MDLVQPDYPLMLATLAVVLSPLAVLGWLAVRLLRLPREPAKGRSRTVDRSD